MTTIQEIGKLIEVALKGAQVAAPVMVLNKDTLEVMSGSLTVERTTGEVPSITGSRLVETWTVVAWEIKDQGGWNPPEPLDRDVGEYQSASEAATAVALEIVRDRILGALEVHHIETDPEFAAVR